MRASVVKAWPAMCRKYEGVTTYMYCDTKGLVTTGVGFLIDSVRAAQTLPWQTEDGKPASAGQIQTEWNRVKGKQEWKKYNGLSSVWSKSAVLFLPMSVVDAKLLETTAKFWARLGQALPKIETFPADAQLAIMDESWQNGPAYLDSGTSWTGTRAAVLAQNWSAAASHVPGNAGSDRKTARIRLFNNAAKVVKLGIDPEILWDTKTPVADSKPPVVVTPPAAPTKPPQPTTDSPEVIDVAKVKFRGGWTCSCVATSLPVVEQAMIERGLIKQSIDVYQLGYRTDVGASAGTHAAGGNTDVAQFSDEQIKVWREFGWTIQHRTKAQGFDMDHGHGWPWGCTHLSAGGKSQATQWSKRQNGLASHGSIAGKWPVPNWRDAMNDYLKQKAEEMPTPNDLIDAMVKSDKLMSALAAAVLNADVIPNNFTSNTANEFVSPKTAFSQIGKQLDDISAAIAPTPIPPVPVTNPIV